jgi:hypothetical protein
VYSFLFQLAFFERAQLTREPPYIRLCDLLGTSEHGSVLRTRVYQNARDHSANVRWVDDGGRRGARAVELVRDGGVRRALEVDWVGDDEGHPPTHVESGPSETERLDILARRKLLLILYFSFLSAYSGIN